MSNAGFISSTMLLPAGFLSARCLQARGPLGPAATGPGRGEFFVSGLRAMNDVEEVWDAMAFQRCWE